jgi:hypothetical protein
MHGAAYHICCATGTRQRPPSRQRETAAGTASAPIDRYATLTAHIDGTSNTRNATSRGDIKLARTFDRTAAAYSNRARAALRRRARRHRHRTTRGRGIMRRNGNIATGNASIRASAEQRNGRAVQLKRATDRGGVAAVTSSKLHSST